MPIPILPPLPRTVAEGRLPGWRLDTTVHRACPVCARDVAERICVRPDGLSVSSCRGCTMTYVADIPAPAEIARFYSLYGGFRGYRKTLLSSAAHRVKAWADWRVRALKQAGGLAGKQVLEIGASYGAFLELLRTQGALPTAVELDVDACRHLEALGVPSGSTIPADREFDIVCAFQVLEHLEAPRDLVASIARALPIDCRLMVSIPNGGEADVSGPAWVGYRVDLEHLNYFSLRSLGALLAEHGLFVEQYWLTSQPTIARGESSSDSAGLVKVARWVAGLGRAALGASEKAQEGSFVLTVLARKCDRAG